MKVKVIARKAKDLACIEEVFEALNWRNIIQRDDRVLIKPNFLTEPKQGVTTDLKLLSCVIEIVSERTRNLMVGETDSTGRNFDSVIEKLDLDCKIINLSKDKTQVVEGRYGSYRLPALALNSKLINLPILKAHVLTRVTLAIKNLFGFIQDKEKEPYHWRMDKLLYDLYHIFNPEINLLDAIYSMDKKGPSKGRVRKTDFVLASKDALALDLAACRIIGLNPAEVGHLNLIGSRDYELVGDEIAMHLEDFQVPEVSRLIRIGAFLQQYSVTRRLIRHPLIKKIKGQMR